MSGLTVGPYGGIYWSIGDIGLNVEDQKGEQWKFPHQGAILRSNPDGSDFEVFAAGLRNTHEFVFDKYGSLISIDNDGDHAGETERIVHLINGSDSGWPFNWQFGKYSDPRNNEYNPWMDEEYFRPHFEGQAAHLLPPVTAYRDGPAGMVYNPGTALGKAWREHFFVATFMGSPGRSGVDAFTLTPEGASYELERKTDVMRGIQVTSMDVGPEGSLCLADWVEGWDTNDRGRIWKLDAQNETNAALRERTRQRLAESFEEKSGDELITLMGHADKRVWRKAQFELASREASDPLLEVISDEEQLRRIHGIWGIGQLGRQNVNHVKPFHDWVDADGPPGRRDVHLDNPAGRRRGPSNNPEI